MCGGGDVVHVLRALAVKSSDHMSYKEDGASFSPAVMQLL